MIGGTTAADSKARPIHLYDCFEAFRFEAEKKRSPSVKRSRYCLRNCLAAAEARYSGGASARPAPHFQPGFNLFTPEQDIELGRRSAAEVAGQVPLLKDGAIVSYVQQLSARLASRAPGYKFPYQFGVIATREINAFALPGGFIFVNAGAIVQPKMKESLPE
jgi:predicted Zn-dependent protease